MQRLNGYLAAWGSLQSVLGALAYIDTSAKMLAHGTAMPKEQAAADQLLSKSQEALDGAEEATEDISIFAWTSLIVEAQRSEDDKALSTIDNTLADMRRPLENSSKQLQDLSD